jgi:hypothetical protein
MQWRRPLENLSQGLCFETCSIIKGTDEKKVFHGLVTDHHNDKQDQQESRSDIDVHLRRSDQ